MKIINPALLQPFFPWIIWRGNRNVSSVFLTFDDGPHPEHTPVILKTLRKYNIRATFFITGQNALRHPGIVRETIQGEHTIGNHGFSHQNLSFKSKQLIRKDILKCDRVIEKISGKNSLFFRPPHGRFDFHLKKIMAESEKKSVIWSLHSYDYMENNSENLTRRIADHLHAGAIILLHDGHKNSAITAKTLPAILDTIKQSGYTCQPLDGQFLC